MICRSHPSVERELLWTPPKHAMAAVVAVASLVIFSPDFDIG
jgi:hypothetical protein